MYTVFKNICLSQLENIYPEFYDHIPVKVVNVLKQILIEMMCIISIKKTYGLGIEVGL